MARSRFQLAPWILLLPATVLLVAFTHYPAVMTMVKSLYRLPKGSRPAKFVGTEHYVSMINDPVFWASLKNSMIYALGTVPMAIGLSMLMAIIVNSAIKGRSLMRMFFFLPTILPMIAVANIWLFFYTPSYGLIDQFLSLFGFEQHNWLGDPDTALGSLMVTAIWKEAGFFMIFYLAALQQMNPTLAEAAALEGAGRWYFFRRVTFPLLMPTTLFVMINAIINSFRLIDHVIVLTRGGPDNASTILLYYIYMVAFRYWDTAYASALTMVLLVILAGLAFIQFGILDRKIHYK
ncbi:MAG: sugar ABC transporter permease [Rhizobiaceae bacterium]|nr:sugar ABC transporter permease [Rhizobiaceae bacterium]